MQREELTTYLHENIPISRAMRIDVVEMERDRVAVTAPLQPNINPHQTVFAGCASAVAIMAAYVMIRYRLHLDGFSSPVVIRRYTMRFDRPTDDTFFATCCIRDEKAWQTFMDDLHDKNRGRIELSVDVSCRGAPVGVLDGEFVGLGLEVD